MDVAAADAAESKNEEKGRKQEEREKDSEKKNEKDEEGEGIRRSAQAIKRFVEAYESGEWEVEVDVGFREDENEIH